MRVLLVEDEDFTRTMVGEMLSASGITVRPVASVAEALNVIDEFDPNVVLTDLDLGDGKIDGLLLYGTNTRRG